MSFSYVIMTQGFDERRLSYRLRYTWWSCDVDEWPGMICEPLGGMICDCESLLVYCDIHDDVCNCGVHLQTDTRQRT